MRKEYDFTKARRGAVLPVATGKTRITIRLDDDILEWFRAQVHAAGGGNYQTLINLVPGATPGTFQNAQTDTPGRSLRCHSGK